MTEGLARIRSHGLAALVPPPRRRLSDWIEENVNLPAGVSAEPGPVQLWPFQRDIADAVGDPMVERVTLVKPVRVGFTTLLTGALAGYVANDPAPILALLPTEADARDYVVSDIEPIFAASPALAGALGKGTDDAAHNTLLSRRFAGGSLKVVAAKAPRNLRRHNVRVLLIDEADAMEGGAEGSPIRLAERRTLSFADRKIVLGSTPIFEETSHVLAAYAQSDKRVFEVPCPSCGVFSEITWAQIVWPPDRPEEAAWRCPACEELIAERHKPAMIEAGAWRATAPEVQGHAGFRMNALVSLLPNASWSKLATEFLAAKRDPAELQVFTNTILAEGWRIDGEELDENELAARAEAFGLDALPESVLAITAGVDVQHDRLEVTLVGWSQDETAWVLGHSVVWGAYDDDLTWTELDEMLSTRWAHPLGGKLGLDAAVIDAGDGAAMEIVLSFCGPRARRKLLAGKGAEGSRPFIAKSHQKQRGAPLWIVGVDSIKAALTSRLAREGLVRFSADLPAVWFEQLASERAVVRYSRGQPRRRFERIAGKRAEALDCTVYAFAARQVINPPWAQREADLRRGVDSGQPDRRPKVIRSNWLGG
ncbi:phage terminase large subunit family protein [Roseovarius salinarum]|uniref:phage terminase large subunit family protein n=1 Tax=Roseovarius salinarum TaxID=1981892 RepID=UPI000C347041|nr:phage terminase large subunit family protein [Roseovarius salinarum]